MKLGTIHKLDCILGMKQLKAGSVDLAFADPPFNIGFSYDVYDDSKDAGSYVNWCREWMAQVHRVLKPDGTFWLAIGDEYAAELKIECQKLGFTCRSWVIWYYTFGVNCKLKFSRSHAHLFHFVKDAKHFTFNRQETLVPSARQLVYADKRAAEGRLPDDTWILRPQDLTDGLTPDEDVWYFPRVAGTFKEREGFHGCQMPEQLLGRIIRVCSNSGDLVLDPFSGSATSVAVAKKLGRRFVSFDISDEYVERGLKRLEGIEVGDPLDGAPDPKVSVAATPSYTKKATSAVRNIRVSDAADESGVTVPETFEEALIEAFRLSSEGFAADRVMADPNMNEAFLDACLKQGLAFEAPFLNRSLLRIRKAGKLAVVPTTNRSELNWTDADSFLFASEVAWRKMIDLTGLSLDDMLCNPSMARRFDQIASSFAPGFTPLQYRLGAIKLRKAAKLASERSKGYSQPTLQESRRFEDLNLDSLRNVSGLYLVSDATAKPLYAGETLDLAKHLSKQFGRDTAATGWKEYGNDFSLSVLPYSRLKDANLELRADAMVPSLVAYQLRVAQQERPLLNLLGQETIAI